MRTSVPMAILRGLLVTAAVVSIFLFFFPEYRHSLFGIKMIYEAPREDTRNLLLTLKVTEGREVRGKAAPEEPVTLGDTATLEAALEETTLSAGPEFLLDYKIVQVQSEQFAWNQPKPGKLSGFHWQTRIDNRGRVGSVKLEERSNALWAREDVAWLWLGALWPSLPEGRIRPGDGWLGEARAFVSLPEKPEGFGLLLRSQYTLERVRQEDGRTLGEYHWEGDISGEGGIGHFQGKVIGKAVNSVDEKRCLLSEISLDVSGEAPIATPKGLDEADSLKVAWRQKLQARIVRIRPPAPGASPTP